MSIIKFLRMAKKVDQFTYGLLYPAFFGNMVYDLILAKTEKIHFKQLDFYTGLVILFFYALDYMHLYVDVDGSVDKKVENKTWRYIGCDFVTSLIIFFAFVNLKDRDYIWSLSLTGLIPAFIAWYKYELPIKQPHKNLMVWFAGISVFGAVICIFWPVVIKAPGLFLLALGELILYSGYVFFYYPKNAPPEKENQVKQ